MRYRIQGQDVRITDSLRCEAERHLTFALSRFSPSIQQVRLRLIDMNGPRGGVDKRCRIVVTMESGATIVVESEDSDPSAAIFMAAERIGRTVARSLHRRAKTGPGAGLPEFADARQSIDTVSPKDGSGEAKYPAPTRSLRGWARGER